MAAAESIGVVIFDWSELTGEPTPATIAKIEKAYGPDGLGILAVRGVPGFVDARSRALPFARRLGLEVSDDLRARLEHADSSYSFGWSHGKEKLDGKPDTSKGSFYFNPLHDKPVDDAATLADPKLQPFVHPNIWPTEDEIPSMAAACKGLGSLMVDAGAQLSRHVDAYVTQFLAQRGTAEPGDNERLTTVVRTSRTPKARLLLYFPTDSAAAASATTASTASGIGGGDSKDATDAFSSWCGWHLDHGSLTSLTTAMYIDANGREVPCPDPAAGLYIRNRAGVTVRAVLPPDCLAFQIGETAQINSGGALLATPHCVRAAANAPGISRATMAVFMEPEWAGRMATPAGADPHLVLKGAHGEFLPRGVPTIASRWTGDAQTFADFTEKTLAAYY